jgi:hypothetical protein
MKKSITILFGIGMAAWCAYVLSGWYAYTGAWRWLAEWEIQQFGSYREKATLLILIATPLVLLNAPILIINIIRPGTVPYQLLGRPSFGSRSKSVGPGPVLAVILVLAVVVGSTAGVLAYLRGQTPTTFETIDLAGPATPTSRHIVLSGVARTDAILVFRKTLSGTTTSETYIPITAPNWRMGEPVSFFLLPHTSVYTGAGGFQNYAPSTPPFAIKQSGTVFSDGLPGVVRTEYERRGLAMAPTVYVLDTDINADVTIYYVIAGVSGICVLVTLPTWIIVRVKRRRAGVESA